MTLRLTAELGDAVTRHLKRSDGANGVLVGSLKLSIILGLTLKVHLPEHVQSRLLTVLAQTRAALLLDGTSQLPATLTALEAESLAIVTSSDNLILAGPDQTLERKLLSRDGDNSTRGLLGARGVNDGDAAVMSSERETVSAGGERNRVHPSSRVVQILSTNRVERKSLAPNSGRRTSVHTLDKGGEDSGMSIGRSSSQKDRVGVPGYTGDGTADRLLQVLGNPPIVLLLEVADSNDPVTGSDGELVLGRRPAHESSGSADSKKDESWLVAFRRGFPDESVTV
jgi:hypothetical protein